MSSRPSNGNGSKIKRLLHKRRIGEISSAALAETVRHTRVAFSPANVAIPSPTPKDRGGKVTELRIWALSKLAAQHAATDDGVLQFRKEILKGRLLTRDDIEPWIRKQASADGPHTIFLKIPLPHNNKLEIREECLVPHKPLMVSEQWPVHGTQVETLDYPGPGGFVRSEAVSVEGVLGRLRYLSETLAQRYGWQAGQATEFVLTGTTPLIAAFEVGVRFRLSNPALSRVILTLDPTLSPREVAELYRQYRKQVLGGRHRSLSEKHITLVLFASSRPGGETYAETMKAWNQKYRKWRYARETNFGRDVQMARRRLLTPGLLGMNLLGAT